MDPPSPPPPPRVLPPTEADPGIRGWCPPDLTEGAIDGENTDADEMDATDAADENLRDPIPRWPLLLPLLL